MNSYILSEVCVCVSLHATAHVEMSEGNFVELILFLYLSASPGIKPRSLGLYTKHL